MKLHLLRHAKTQAIQPAKTDFERRLLPKGEEQARLIGNYLNDRLSRKITVFCSSSARTRQTAKIVQQHFEFRDIRFEQNLYLADRNALLDFIWNLDQNDDVLLIGHNEGISELASYFTDSYIGLQTAGYVCIEFDVTSWKETSTGLGRLVDAFRPDVTTS